jgi:eukaryotic translation initiation factor 2C
MHIQPQASKQEMINGIGGIAKEMITAYRNQTKVLPKRLLMFRDGVSEGFFERVRHFYFS